MSDDTLTFVVKGTPRPKQSFRYSARGHYTPARIREWQSNVKSEAMYAMYGRIIYTKEEKVEVWLNFRLPDRRKRDIDNLSKGVLDSMNNIVYEDDAQVHKLTITKEVDKENEGVTVYVRAYNDEEIERTWDTRS